MRLRTSLFAAFFAFVSFATSAHENDMHHAVTVPMQLELGRPYIDVTLVGTGGKTVRAHAWVDTGGGAILLSAGLARKLGLEATGKPVREQGHALAPVRAPALRIGGEPIKWAKGVAFIALDEATMLSSSDAQMQIPARELRDHVVTFNYPARTFSVAEQAQPDAGAPMKTYIGDSGMPVVWLSIADRTEGFLLDTGGQFTMVSGAKLHDWGSRHPAWKQAAGAYGPANMLLPHEDRLEMLRVGEMKWGPFIIRDVGAVSRPAGVYEKWMSQMLGQAVIGSIGGNVLRDFCVTIDYPAGKVHLQREGSSARPHPPLAMVGVTLINAPHDGYDIAGTANDVRDVHPGDRLMAVDGHEVTSMPYFRVAAWLSGKPGETRKLAVIRDGKAMTIKASVRSVF